MLHISAVHAATLQHITANDYNSCPFSAGFIPMVGYYSSAIICYISSAEYNTMLHTQCCNVARIWHLTVVE